MERAELARRLGGRRRAVTPRGTVVATADPRVFMERFSAAVASGGTVLVADPTWNAAGRAHFATLRRSGMADGQSPIAEGKGQIGRGWLCLPTGGTSGGVRLARHDQDSLSAAVGGCCRHFGVTRINAVGVLPLHHVSGLMAWLRCALTGGRYLPWSWDDLAAGRWPETDDGDWFLSLVPTQLQRLLARRESAGRLRRFRAVLVGGGPAWPDLLERAARLRLPLAPGYGMTETAAMVTALRPEEFLAGRTGCGAALPHARVTVEAGGVIRVAARSLFRGYYPDWRRPGAWRTEDLGRLDEAGGLQVLGRRDAVIITGGEKVDPGVVEAALLATGRFTDVAVVGVPDPRWGQAVVACYPADMRAPDLRAVGRALAAGLAPHQRPKHFVAVDRWPRTASGKVSRSALVALATGAGRR